MHALVVAMVIFLIFWWKDIQLGGEIVEKQRRLRELDGAIKAQEQILNPDL